MVKYLKNKNRIKYKITKINSYNDKRGWFLEMIRKNKTRKDIKQVSVASIKPEQIRGNHYHLNKTEWFIVIGGKAKFCLVDPGTSDKICFSLSEKNPKVITVFPGVAHAVKNIDKKTIYFVEADSAIYNHKKPDAISYLICKQ